jgi:hypothetical protein
MTIETEQGVSIDLSQAAIDAVRRHMEENPDKLYLVKWKAFGMSGELVLSSADMASESLSFGNSPNIVRGGVGGQGAPVERALLPRTG